MHPVRYHTPRGSCISRGDALILIKAVISGQTVQYRRKQTDGYEVSAWYIYSRDPARFAGVIADITTDNSGDYEYRIIPTDFLTEWNKTQQHEGVALSTALDWFLIGQQSQAAN